MVAPAANVFPERVSTLPPPSRTAATGSSQRTTAPARSALSSRKASKESLSIIVIGSPGDVNALRGSYPWKQVIDGCSLRESRDRSSAESIPEEIRCFLALVPSAPPHTLPPGTP
jgi:hypothetical protein